MRQIEYVNKELKAAKGELLRWDTRVKALERERKEILAALTAEEV